MSRVIFSLNSGSSSIKFATFVVGAAGPEFVAGGKLEGIGTAPRIAVRDGAGHSLLERTWDDGAALSHEILLQDLFEWVASHLAGHDIGAIGHRVVHGGADFATPVVIDDALLAALEKLSPLAPLHQPHNLAAIRTIRKAAPTLPQVACFDTAFHHDRPAVSSRLAIPRALHDRGIRRYGFHGISYEYLARTLRTLDPALARGRVIAAHLGNGASMCAMLGGKSIDTTMGFTALDGLMMGTRCGALDPGVVLHLQTQDGMSARDVEHLLYRKSGLLGVSGVSSDMRALHRNGSPQAAEAIELFTWRAAREAGGLISSLGGLDGLVFTAGIGENDPVIRAMICKRLAWCGVAIDEAANRQNAPLISAPGSRVAVRIIPTDEERMIALHVLDTLRLSDGVMT